ncbi:DNA binding protein isoform X2 [Wolffia australiana]
MEIQEGTKGPGFMITSAAGHSFSGRTPDECWEYFWKKCGPKVKNWNGKRFCGKIDGTELFGFRNPSVQRLLRELAANVHGVAEQIVPSPSSLSVFSTSDKEVSGSKICPPLDLLVHLGKQHGTRKRSKKRNKFKRKTDARLVCELPTGDTNQVMETRSPQINEITSIDGNISREISLSGQFALHQQAPLTTEGDLSSKSSELGPFLDGDVFPSEHLQSVYHVDSAVADVMHGKSEDLEMEMEELIREGNESSLIGNNLLIDANIRDMNIPDSVDAVQGEIDTSVCTQMKREKSDFVDNDAARTMMELLLPSAVPLLTKTYKRRRVGFPLRGPEQGTQGGAQFIVPDSLEEDPISENTYAGNNKNEDQTGKSGQSICSMTKIDYFTEDNSNPKNILKEDPIPDNVDAGNDIKNNRLGDSCGIVPESAEGIDYIRKIRTDSFSEDNPNAKNIVDEDLISGHISADNNQINKITSKSGESIGFIDKVKYFTEDNSPVKNSREEDLISDNSGADDNKNNNAIGDPCSGLAEPGQGISSIINIKLGSLLEDNPKAKTSLEVDPISDNISVDNNKVNSMTLETEQSFGSIRRSFDYFSEDNPTVKNSDEEDLISDNIGTVNNKNDSRTGDSCNKLPESGLVIRSVTKRKIGPFSETVQDNPKPTVPFTETIIFRDTKNTGRLSAQSCQNELKIDDQCQDFAELLGCYLHPLPVRSVLMKIKEDKAIICTFCGPGQGVDGLIFLYQISIRNPRPATGPSFLGFSSINFSISGKSPDNPRVLAESQGLQLTPDGRHLVLANYVRAPFCRDKNIKCACRICTSNSVKIVRLEHGFASPVAELKSTWRVVSIFASETNHLLGFEERGSLQVWLMDPPWRECVEEFSLPGFDFVVSDGVALKRIPGLDSLILGHNGAQDFCFWDIKRKTRMARFSAPGNRVSGFIPVGWFSLGQNIVGPLSKAKEPDSFWAFFHSEEQGWRLSLLVQDSLHVGRVLDIRASAVGVIDDLGIIGTGDGHVYLWELTTGRKSADLHPFTGGGAVTSVVADEKSGIFAVVGDECELKMYILSKAAR